MEDIRKNIHMEECDDSDIKIADGGSSGTTKNAEDAALDDYDRLRRSGELARARRLGAFIAGKIEDINSSLGVSFNSAKIELHRRLMVIFSAIAAMESGLSERMLVQTALNVFYDTLKKDSPELYDSMSVSGAITFYYLEYRKLGKMPADIGGAFAMLCGKEEDPELIAVGSDLFARTFDFVSGVINNAGFESC